MCKLKVITTLTLIVLANRHFLGIRLEKSKQASSQGSQGLLKYDFGMLGSPGSLQETWGRYLRAKDWNSLDPIPCSS